MEFFFAVFFLLFYFLRPQDWFPGLIGLSLVKPIIAAWMAVLLTNRSRESPLPGVLKTPHDWIIFSYWGYVVWTAPDAMAALTGFFTLVAFYALSVQSINSWARLESYLKWWTIALALVALLAVTIPLGIDLTGGKAYTERFIGRLCLGTWIHNNPNALGHSVVVLVALGYFAFFWRGASIGRFLIYPLIAGLACWCVYQTESKGSFLVGGALVASVFVIGRPRFVQILALVVALTIGLGALSYLPRMSQMGNLRADEGVQGRLLAWEMARGVSKTHSTGVGWQQFIALIDWKEGDRMIYDIPKSTHSSYVQVGADLGKYGLFLYLAGLWCVLHTLLRFKPANDVEDRCRRMIWILLLSTLISGWMINRQYHTEYFLLVAAAAALHRLGKSRELTAVSADPEPVAEAQTSDPPVTELEPEATQENGGETLAFTSRDRDEQSRAKPLWNKFGLVDVGVCIGLTWLTFWLWDYILENI